MIADPSSIVQAGGTEMPVRIRPLEQSPSRSGSVGHFNVLYKGTPAPLLTGKIMKYKTLIKRFEKYAEEEVSIVAGNGDVVFFPVSDGNIEIIHLIQGESEPFRAKEVKG